MNGERVLVLGRSFEALALTLRTVGAEWPGDEWWRLVLRLLGATDDDARPMTAYWRMSIVHECRVDAEALRGAWRDWSGAFASSSTATPDEIRLVCLVMRRCIEIGCSDLAKELAFWILARDEEYEDILAEARQVRDGQT